MNSMHFWDIQHVDVAVPVHFPAGANAALVAAVPPLVAMSDIAPLDAVPYPH